MKKKLQRRFMLTGVAAVAILLVLIEVGFHVLSYRQMYRSLDLTLSYIISHEEGEEPPEGVLEQTEASTEEDEPDAGDGSVISGVSGRGSGSGRETEISDEENLLYRMVSGFREFGKSIIGNVEITPESKYRMRYFLITLDRNGNVTDASLSHIAEISRGTAEKLAREHYHFKNSRGLLNYSKSCYYYKTVQQEDGSSVVGFLECTQEVRGVNAMRGITLLVCLLVVILFSVILSLLSRRAIAPFVENMESQKEFITNAGHELKTPLAIISANTEVIEMMDGKSEWTDSIMAQVKRSTGLINSMLALARMNETQKVELTSVSLSEVVRECVSSFTPVIQQQKKRIDTQIAEDVTVLGDRNLLTELSNILVDNAVKYCDDDGAVSVTLKKKGKTGAVLAVANDYRDGGGQDYSLFFRRFYRGDTSHNSKKAGHGIGLSMAKSIAEKMNGSISAAWKDGVITFTVVI